jgi:nitrite reductase/ring-hydroxylating ferredoxin subunit
MCPSRSDNTEPLWRDEFAIRTDHERYVTRRQFGKFLGLTSLGMFVGNAWILARTWLQKEPSHAAQVVATLGDVPVGGVKLFAYPGPQDPCILIQPEAGRFVAYSQKCTHLSCAVYYAAEQKRIECPCHEGYFSVESGQVLQGPPPRPLPRIILEQQGDSLIATGVDLQTESPS